LPSRGVGTNWPTAGSTFVCAVMEHWLAVVSEAKKVGVQ
jgi:hypothetical protein